MSAELFALILAVGVPLALRLIDALLPKGRHFKVAERFTVPDDDEDDDKPTEKEDVNE